MIPYNELLIFALAALVMVLSPGPNMIYLISQSLSQGKKAGIISLIGVMCGFLFHIIMVSLGLTAVFFAIPFAFSVVKFCGVFYLLYLAYNAIRSGDKNLFAQELNTEQKDSTLKLFNIGLLTNVLNPKMAVFYLSFFPQFIKIEYGSVLTQSFQLGITQILISFTINLLIVLFAAHMSVFFAKKPIWLKVQKWFMASVLVSLAIKLSFAKAK